MPTTPKTLAELQAEEVEIQRQKAEIQLPVLTAVKDRLAQSDIADLIAELKAGMAQLDTEHATQVGHIVTTLTNVPTYVAAATARLNAIVDPPTTPAPTAPPAEA